MVVHVAFPNACCKWPKLRADAEMSLCGTAFIMNWFAQRLWKHWIMSCSRVDEHSATIHSETHSAYIYSLKLQPLLFDNGTKPYSDFAFIWINRAAASHLMILFPFPFLSSPVSSSYFLSFSSYFLLLLFSPLQLFWRTPAIEENRTVELWEECKKG